MSFEIGTQVKQVGSDAVWTITSTMSRGSVYATLNVRTGKPGEIHTRKITKAQRADWTLA